HRFPHFLPDGKQYLYLSQAVPKAGERESDVIYASSLGSKERKALLRVRSNALFAPLRPGLSNGYLIFVRERTLLAQPFDAKELRFTGEAVPVGESVGFFANFGFATFAVSENGLLAYQSGGAGGASKLVWFDRTGKELETVGPPSDYGHPRVSHDG